MVSSSNSTSSVGAAKEELACQYLETQGLRLVARNVRYRNGEIDLIMQDKGCLVFVEVRYRRNCRFGTPQETVNWTKRQRLRSAARQYLQRYPTHLACRFDIIAITDTQPIEWLRDAFQDG